MHKPYNLKFRQKHRGDTGTEKSKKDEGETMEEKATGCPGGQTESNCHAEEGRSTEIAECATSRSSRGKVWEVLLLFSDTLPHALPCSATLMAFKRFRCYKAKEDCEGCWFSVCHNSVAEHWLQKPDVLCLNSGDCWPFDFPLFCLITFESLGFQCEAR